MSISVPTCIRIRVFCPFARNAHTTFERINFAHTFPFYGPDKSYMFTNGNDYTHAIIINTAQPDLPAHVTKDRVIGLAFEPVPFLHITPAFVEYATKHIGRYLIGDATNLPAPFEGHFAYMWHSRPPAEIPYLVKLSNNLMSIALSRKQGSAGQKYRHTLVRRILQERLPIDIFGHGSDDYKSLASTTGTTAQIKGKFNDAEPYEGYAFSLCIENIIHPHYFSEKVITPLLHNCTPLYLGCTNISNYVDGTISITGQIEEDIALLRRIFTNPEIYWQPTYTTKNLNAVNLVANLPRLFPI